MEAIYTEIRILLFAIWRLRWIAIAVAWVVCLVGWTMVMRIPSSFESASRISVQVRSQLTGQVGIDDSDRQKDIDRVRQSLTSTETLKRVVQGVTNGERPLTSSEAQALIGALQSGISITVMSDNLLEISTRVALPGVPDRQTAHIVQSVTEQLVDIFVQENLMGSRDENQQTLAFLDAELARRGKQLADADRQRAVIAQQTMGGLPGSGSLDDRLDAARTELASVQSNLMSAQSSLAAMNGQIAATPASIPLGGGAGGSADQRVAVLEGQLSDAVARGWTDMHPDVIAIKAQLAQARADQRRGGGAVSGPSTPNPVYVSLRSMQAERQGNVAMLAARKAQLEADLSAIAQRQISAPDDGSDGSRIERDYGVLKDQYNKLLSDREAAKLRADATSKSNNVAFRVIDQASLPSHPAAPNRPMLLSGVLFAALAIGAGVAFAKSQLANSYTTTQQLARASGLPVLGSISEVVTIQARATKRQQLMWFSSAMGGLAGVYAILLGVEFVKRLMLG